LEKKGEVMREESKTKRGSQRRMWGAAEGVEAERVEELLELIWTMREKGVSDLGQLLETTPDVEANHILRLMIKDDLFNVDGNRVVLKERGEEKAREIIRRHRLTERLLSEIFEMSEEEVEEEACKLEHILSPGVTEASAPSSDIHLLVSMGSRSQEGVLCEIQERDEASRHPS
jgi:Mn-dependent DtxR family transcriptional regulator